MFINLFTLRQQDAQSYLEEAKQQLSLPQEVAARAQFVQGDFFSYSPEAFDWGYDYT